MYLRAPLRLLSSSTFSAFLRISLLSIYNTKTICFRAINHSSMWVMLCLQAKLWRISIDQKFHFQSTNMRLPFIYNSYVLFLFLKSMYSKYQSITLIQMTLIKIYMLRTMLKADKTVNHIAIYILVWDLEHFFVILELKLGTILITILIAW